MAPKLLFLALAIGLLVTVVIVQRRALKRERAAALRPAPGQFVELDGGRIHLVVEGVGPPLILLHGASGNHLDFSPLMASLTSRYTVVRMDRPGLGWSELPPRYRTLWKNAAPGPVDQARILSDAYRTLGLGPALVMGQSYGGAVALAWALERPEDLSGLVPVSAVSNHWTEPLNWVYRINSHPLGAAFFVPLVTAFATPDGIGTVLQQIFAPQDPPNGYAEMLGIDLSLRRKTLIANARQIYVLRDAVTAMAARYGAISVPTEIVHGAADAIVPLNTHSAPLSQQIPHASLTRLPGIGHMPHHVASREVIEAIDRAALRAGLHEAQTLGTVVP